MIVRKVNNLRKSSSLSNNSQSIKGVNEDINIKPKSSLHIIRKKENSIYDSGLFEGDLQEKSNDYINLNRISYIITDISPETNSLYSTGENEKRYIMEINSDLEDMANSK